MPTVNTREDALALDQRDPLAKFRDAFVYPEGLIYFDGNSLGMLPKATPERVRQVVEDEWGQGLIRSWVAADWIGAPERLGAKVARLIGADSDEVIVTDTLSLNIFKALAACVQINNTRSILLSETGNFPTDVYMMEGLATLSERHITPKLVAPEDIEAHLTEDVCALLLTQTHYKFGSVRDMKALTEKAHAKGILVIWDLAHSAGAVPVNVHDVKADFALGCGYKYLNGGPGAPSFLYVARRHQNESRPVLPGWLGHAAPFAFSDQYEPASGMRRYVCSSPSLLHMAALEVGLDLLLEADDQERRAKSQALTSLFLELVQTRCGEFGFEPACPLDRDARGSQVSFRHEEGYAIVQALIARGVIGDFRDPNIMRFGFAPLYNTFTEVWDAVDILHDIMTTRSWDKPEFKHRGKVT
ncbi:kynureninase [Woodsholea maritima]|uniref:kynureninase n=1 Tax=Woodsholea maritima TaxID=240237 RepID=UPI00035F307B|nr:kynureninase [Woodsholea maritima]